MLSRKTFVHIICWILLIAYELAIAIYMGSHAPIWHYAGMYALNIILFYFNAHIVFRQVKKEENSFFSILLLILWIFLELTVYSFLRLSLSFYFNKLEGFDSHFFSGLYIIRNIWRGIYFIGLSFAYWLVMEKIKATKHAHSVENAYLKAQINPHLLFNTLNFIYNQVEESSPKARESVELLSDMMRYSLNKVGVDDKVELKKEIEQVKRYIRLNQLRITQKLKLEVDIDFPHNEGLRILPLILLTFVENMFKHGNLVDPEKPGLIRLNFNSGILHLHTENAKKSDELTQGHNMGIQNVKDRLKTHYKKDDYLLGIRNEGGNFILDLKIRL